MIIFYLLCFLICAYAVEMGFMYDENDSQSLVAMQSLLATMIAVSNPSFSAMFPGEVVTLHRDIKYKSDYSDFSATVDKVVEKKITMLFSPCTFLGNTNISQLQSLDAIIWCMNPLIYGQCKNNFIFSSSFQSISKIGNFFAIIL